MYRKTYDGDGKNNSLEEGSGSRISIPYENRVDVHPQLVHRLVARTHWLYRPGSANVRDCGYLPKLIHRNTKQEHCQTCRWHQLLQSQASGCFLPICRCIDCGCCSFELQ